MAEKSDGSRIKELEGSNTTALELTVAYAIMAAIIMGADGKITGPEVVQAAVAGVFVIPLIWAVAGKMRIRS